MLKSYLEYSLNENILFSLDDVIEIIKRLESEDNRNSDVINKLVNYKNKNTNKTILMSLVENNNIELLEYVLKFKPDINTRKSDGKNVLFYCKNVKVFNMLYNSGADVLVKDFNKNNVIMSLASKLIFNEELYQNLINDGVNINDMNSYGQLPISYLYYNNSAVKFLLKNNLNLNINSDFQNYIISTIFDKYKLYTSNKRSSILKSMDLMISYGFKIIDSKKLMEVIKYDFFYNLIDEYKGDSYKYKIIDLYSRILNISDDRYFKILLHHTLSYDNDLNLSMLKDILNTGIYPNFYKDLLHFYSYQQKIIDELKFYKIKYPYILSSDKYNI